MTSRRAVGVYALVLELPADCRIEVGRLGRYAFPAGFYIYAGSAMGGLEARLARHIRLDKRLHWHIDYLRARTEVVDVYVARGQSRRRECELATAVSTLPGARMVVTKFGATDCRCRSHLFWMKDQPNLLGLVDGLTCADPI